MQSGAGTISQPGLNPWNVSPLIPSFMLPVSKPAFRPMTPLPRSMPLCPSCLSTPYLPLFTPLLWPLLTPLLNTLPTMYPNNQQQQQQPQPQQQQQRNTSNPRAFPTSDSPIVGGERRDDQAYATDNQGNHQYANYQQQQQQQQQQQGSYSAVPNYGQYNSPMK